jgi:transcriptional regulator with XRE-family HTH domain
MMKLVDGGLALSNSGNGLVSDLEAPESRNTARAVDARRIRVQRGLSLERLARLSGVSRAMLGQIELGRSVPSVTVAWKVAHALQVSLTELMATRDPGSASVLSVAQAKRLSTADGGFVSRALFPEAEPHRAQFYELTLGPGSRERLEPQQAGTRENLIVTCGYLDLTVASARYRLVPGDAILFDADVVRIFENRGGVECCLYLVVA